MLPSRNNILCIIITHMWRKLLVFSPSRMHVYTSFVINAKLMISTCMCACMRAFFTDKQRLATKLLHDLHAEYRQISSSFVCGSFSTTSKKVKMQQTQHYSNGSGSSHASAYFITTGGRKKNLIQKIICCCFGSYL